MKDNEEKELRDLFVRRCSRLFGLMEMSSPPAPVGYEVALIVQIARMLPGVREAYTSKMSQLDLESSLRSFGVEGSEVMDFDAVPSVKDNVEIFGRLDGLVERLGDVSADVSEEERNRIIEETVEEFIQADDVLSSLISDEGASIDWFGEGEEVTG